MALALASDSLKHRVSKESRNDQTINKASWSFETPWTKDQGYKTLSSSSSFPFFQGQQTRGLKQDTHQILTNQVNKIKHSKDHKKSSKHSLN